jgi:two-component system sensor histidine kinase VicK
LSSPVRLPDITSGERTEIVYGVEDVTKFSEYGLSLVENRIDVCGDYTMPSVILASEQVRDGYYRISKRGVRIRWITDITSENISACKEIMKIAELRHIDGVKGGFVVADEKVYVATAQLRLEKPVTQLIYSNVKAIVEQQQYMFNTLWNKAIPSIQRIKEIEEGLTREFIQAIQDPIEIQELGFNLVKSAADEILILFSTANAFHRQIEHAGGSKLLKQAAKERKVKIRILTPMDRTVEQSAQKLIEEKDRQPSLQRQEGQPDIDIDIRYIEPDLQTKVTILLIDRRFSLTVELKDDTKENSYEAIGLATYSNSKSTVLSYVSIFESLWKQTELYQQLKEANNKLNSLNNFQKDFINIAAHELRNPIQPILGLSEVLSSLIKDSRQHELIDVIYRNAKSLHRLSEDILDITRIESQSLQLNKERFNIIEVIQNAIRDSKNINRKNNNKKDLKIELLSPENESIFVTADKGRVNQVIFNILNNAVRFTEDTTGGRITFMIEKDDDDQEVVINVKDTGKGIDPEIMPKLFTRSATKSSGGSGLGLYISKNIVEAHGGKIWAENNADGTGATFRFSFPINQKK